MEKVDKTLSTAYIHSVYSGSTTARQLDGKQAFQSTSQFERDPSHSGHAPEHAVPSRKPFRK